METVLLISDCKVEKSLLHSEVYPTLRDKCRRASFELHIVDLHWSLQDQTAEPGELCLQELSSKLFFGIYIFSAEKTYLLILIFFVF